MSDPVSPPPTARFSGSFITPDDYVPRLVRTFLIYSLTRPRALASVFVPIVVGVAIAFAYGTSQDRHFLLAATIVIVLFCVGLGILIGILRTRSRLRRQLTATIPPDSLYTISLTDDSFHLRSPLTDGTVSYRAYETADRRRDFVFIKHRGSRVYLLLPGQLFTPDALEFLRAKITPPAAAS